MTVTVIIIIAVIVVLAVLVLLLLGMRALSTTSPEDDYDDEQEYESTEADDRGRGRGRGGQEAPRRARRARAEEDGEPGRRPRGRRKRDADWEDDDLSDNGFWSSLGDGDRDDGRAADDVADGRAGDSYDDVEAYGDDGYDEEYDDYEDEGYGDEPDPAPERARGGVRAGGDTPGARPAVTSGPSDDLAVLASLGQNSGPAPEPRTGDAPIRAQLPRAEESPVEAPRPEPSRDDDPLGTGPWTPDRALPSASSEPTAWNGSADRDPLGGSGSTSTYGGSYTGSSSAASPSGSSASGDPLSGASGYGTGPSGFGALPRSSGSGSTDPLDPGFRPSTRSEDSGSPIWSSMDTGSHQRPTPPPPSGYDRSGLDAPGGYDTGTHRYPSYDTGAHSRSAYDTGTHAHGSHETGAHTRGAYGTPPFPDPGTHTAPGSYARPEYDTGTHAHRPYDTGSHTRGGYGASAPSAFDSGTHQRSHDSGTHARGSYTNEPLWGDDALGGPSSPTVPAPQNRAGGFGGGHAAPGEPGGSPFDTGGYSRFPSEPTPPGGTAYTGGSRGLPTGGRPAGPPPGEVPGDALPGYGPQPPRSREPYGNPDALDGGYTGQRPGYGGGHAPAEGWGPWDGTQNGAPPLHGHPPLPPPSAPYGPPHSAPDAPHPPARGRDHYEGGYEDGRFI
ncbi:hypothetical protein ACIBFB_20585 [Nocardiopsis sp. NPDC050513]|uniref:hypothetical protein n=1 Tax=Nocardiopsis sp. NPDC050513 TaxID=3364338 RepID=UPI0037B895ED